MEVPDDDAGLDAWIADIEAYVRELDPLPELDWPEMRPYVSGIRQAVQALQAAREHTPPRVRFALLIDLAQAVEDARRVEGELRVAGLYKQLDAKEEILLDYEQALRETDSTDEARQAALAQGRAKLKEQETRRTERIEAVRPEFEELRRAFGSAKRAAESIEKRHPELNLKAEALRKRFRR